MGMKNRFQEAIQNVQRQRHLARRSVAMVLVLAMLLGILPAVAAADASLACRR